jgi:hypothetical protein
VQTLDFATATAAKRDKGLLARAGMSTRSIAGASVSSIPFEAQSRQTPIGFGSDAISCVVKSSPAQTDARAMRISGFVNAHV